jgi:multiple sugar transport system permease protein
MRRKPALPIRLIVYAAIVFVAVIINLPFFMMLVTSFKTEDAAFSIPPAFCRQSSTAEFCEGF